MTTLGKASEEHERIVQAIAQWYASARVGFKNIKTPAEEVDGSQPDVQADGPKGRIYGEAKLCEDFPAEDTKEQLTRYVGLPAEYNFTLGIPNACRDEAEKALKDWKLDGLIQVMSF